MAASNTTTSQQILLAAQRITFGRGVSALRVDKLAFELGMSKKTLYAYYTSKAELLDAMLALHFEYYEERFRAVLDDPNLNFLGRLKTTMQLGWEANSKMSDDVIQDFRRHAAALWHKYELRKAQEVQRHFQRLLLEGQQQGYLRASLRLDIIVDVLMEIITYQLTPDGLREKSYSVQEAHQAFYHLLFEGLLTDSARQEYAAIK